MRTEYRKKPPYYKKYKYKTEIALDEPYYSIIGNNQKTGKRRVNISEVKKFLSANLNEEDYKIVHAWSYYVSLYFTEKDKADVFIGSEYGRLIKILTKPPLGYTPSVKDFRTPGKDKLWYGRFAYKITLLIKKEELDEIVEWCEQNCFSSYRKSGYGGNISFFFLTSLDAIGFKLRFSDNVRETIMPDNKTSEKLLRERIAEAKKDLKEFLGGI